MNRFSKSVMLVAYALAALVVAACGGGHAFSPAASTPPLSTDGHSGTLKKHKTPTIDHVVVIIQENRSLDNLFDGYPGANTVSVGAALPTETPCGLAPKPGVTPTAIPLAPISMTAKYDISHNHFSFLHSYNKKKMDGFSLACIIGPERDKYPYPEYAYVPQSESQPYWTMANQYVLADNMFSSTIDGSFVAHQFLIAGQANREVDFPTGKWGCPGNTTTTIRQLLPDPNPQHKMDPSPPIPVCEDYPAITDELDSAGLTWKTYTTAIGPPPGYNESTATYWNGFQAINHIYNGPDWTPQHIVSPSSAILSDIAKGTLANVTWVIPTFANSDHPNSGKSTGPSWVASVVDAVGNSQFWDTTMIFVVWDDWGGFYDHATPADIDFDGLGFRVPLLCISPYAYAGQVNHDRLEFGSILRYIENNWNLAQLAASDTRAEDATKSCTNPSQSQPRAFQQISAPYGKTYFLRERPDYRPVDTE